MGWIVCDKSIDAPSAMPRRLVVNRGQRMRSRSVHPSSRYAPGGTSRRTAKDWVAYCTRLCAAHESALGTTRTGGMSAQSPLSESKPD